MRSLLGTMLTVAILFTASPSSAGPITTGVWSLAEPGTGVAFWDNPSVDCDVIECNAGSLLSIIYGPLEYLHDGHGHPVPFAFDEPVSPRWVASLSAWKGGVFTQELNGSFSYRTGRRRHVHNSLDQGWQFSLFRQVTPGLTLYFIGLEDIRMDLAPNDSDRDYNDHIVAFETATVPEPSTLLLMGGAVVVALRRARRASRRSVGQLRG